MRAEYGEIAAPGRIADAVECLWWQRTAGDSAILHRVPPDGCADILFKHGPAGATLQAVGAMTRWQDFELPARQLLIGVRFRPGMWAARIGTPADRITDQLIPLEDLWGARARRLLEQLGDTRSAAQCASLLAASVGDATPRSPLQRAVSFMEARGGHVSMDEMASAAGLSPRQFRRLCLLETGLSPKFLARVLRFRRALTRVRAEAGDHAGLAAECGYTDQSHFIADFREFCGQTPAAFLNRG